MGLTRPEHAKRKSTSASAVSGSKISVAGVDRGSSRLEATEVARDVARDVGDGETEREAAVGLLHGEVAVVSVVAGREDVDVAGELELGRNGGYAKSRTLIGGCFTAGVLGRGSSSQTTVAAGDGGPAVAPTSTSTLSLTARPISTSLSRLTDIIPA